MHEIYSKKSARLENQDRGPDVIAIVSTFMAFAIICVGFRIFTRLKITKMLGLEDVFIVLAMTSAIALGVFQIKQAEWGNGRHQRFIDSTATEWMMMYLYCSILAYNLAIFFVRISILLQYRRIFVTSQGVWTANTAVIIICIAYGIESVFVGVFLCVPVDAFWDSKKRPTASCINENAWYYANAGLNVAIDLLIAALPVRAIWSLHVSIKQKVALQLILTIGWFICIVSILRVQALIVLGNHTEDSSWYGAAPAYFSAIEVQLAIVCASLPALKPLLSKAVPDFVIRYLSNRSRVNRTTPSDQPSFVRSGENQSWHATVESRSEEDSTQGLTLPANRIIVMRKFERHSDAFGVNLGDTESTDGLVEGVTAPKQKQQLDRF